MVEEMRKCSQCGETKPVNDFRSRNGRPRQPCLECDRLRQAARRAADPEKSKAESRRSFAKQRGSDAVLARELVSALVRSGVIKPAKERLCVHCGAPASVLDHHNGYDGDNARDVVPVCDECDNALRILRGEFHSEYRRPLPTKVKARIALYPSLVGVAK